MALTPKLHSSSWFYLAIGLLGVTAFFLVGVFPNIRAIEELDQNIADLTNKVQVQELLHPVYRELIREVQRQVPALPLPENSKMSRNEIGHLDKVFMELAQTNQVVFESAAPDASSYLEDSDRLIVNVAFKGDFFKFQKLLLELSKVPYLASIDRLSIQTDTDGKRLSLKLHLYQE